MQGAPSTSSSSSAQKRTRQEPPEQQFSQPSLSDRNPWFYPAHAYYSHKNAVNSLRDYEDNYPDGKALCASTAGNWGQKSHSEGRWVRFGKPLAWGPEIEDWETENRTRKRIKLLVESSHPELQEGIPPRPKTPTLPHLAPAPPSTPPTARKPRGLPPPAYRHASYSSYILDRSTTRAFRAGTLGELERSAQRLIEGETAVRQVLGRLWVVLGEKQRLAETRKRRPRQAKNSASNKDAVMVNNGNSNDAPKTNGIEPEDGVVKRESGSEEGDIDMDVDPDTVEGEIDNTDLSERATLLRLFASSSTGAIEVEKALLALRSMQDDSREYVERLQEIRNGLGEVVAHRSGVWDEVRTRGIHELKEQALATAD